MTSTVETPSTPLEFEENEFLQEALSSGVELSQYIEKINTDIKAVEAGTIGDSLAQLENLNGLYGDLKTTDDTLAGLEGILQEFQNSLGSISSEIQQLQSSSLDISIKLKNRQDLHQNLCQFVDELAVSEGLISMIMECPVTEQDFIEALHELNHKIKFVREQQFANAAGAGDVEQVVEKLKFKAVAKLREFLLQKIFTFRRPLTNYQVSQNTMLKHRFFYEFLLHNDRHTAGQIRDEYIETTSKMYLSYFKDYVDKLMKLEFARTASKTDLIGKIDELRAKSAKAQMSALFTKNKYTNRGTVFTLGGRGQILEAAQLEGPVIVPHADKKQDCHYHYETLFRSIHFALLDNCCREYLFLKDFFLVEDSALEKLFNKIMGRSLEMVKNHIMDQVEKMYDSIALLICNHIIYRFQITCHKRNVPCLDGYWNQVLSVMRPKLENIMYANISSIQTIDIRQLDIDTRPHYVTRRYAEYAAAVSLINEQFSDERINMIMLEMQQSIEVCIQQIATVFPDRKSQLVFFINNYDVILSVMNETTSEPSKEAQIFSAQLKNRCSEYVELTLQPFIGQIMDIVNEQSSTTSLTKPQVQQICDYFNDRWKLSIDKMNNEIMRSFTNFKNGTSLLQNTLNGLVQYYAKFQKIIQREPLLSDVKMTNVHQIMMEVKKYKTTF